MTKFKKILMVLAASFASASAWAFNDYPTVTTLPQDLNTKQSYMLISARGALYADASEEANHLTSNCQNGRHNGVANLPSDPRFQFLLYKATDESKGYYIYSVQMQKFVKQEGMYAAYSDQPALNFIWKHGVTGSKNNDYGKMYEQGDYPWCIGNEESYGPYQTINVCYWDASNGYPDYRWCTTGSLDGGNEYSIAEAETVSDAIWQDGYDKVVAYEANLGGGGGGNVDLDPTNVLTVEEQARQTAAALDIIERFTEGAMEVEVILDLCRTTKGCDRYTYQADDTKLTVHASCAVAACRGFYDYVKAKHAGFISWSGKRFEKPADMACDEVSLVTQFRDHQYFNVVTYGYTAPFWGKDRWRKELDWMAFHGVDMPLMLVGSEAIYREVFTKDFGLTDDEVSEWEVGPAHLPWFRMGNLSGNSFDGPLGNEWYENQRELAHYLLEEMYKLGMKPVCPAFGGFVPRAFSKTGSTPTTVGWGWCKPSDRNVPNYRLMPGDPKFMEVGKAFMKRWEDEYCSSYPDLKYYLSDSFNEMDVPDAATLVDYGTNIFSIIQSSKNPKSVWVTQGWTFCYDIGKWHKAKFDALTQNVDNDRFIALYMSPEYADHYGHSRDFDTDYRGFSGKGWNCTMLPNMGGKNFWTGNLTKYAKGYLNDLYNMADQGNLVGYGMTPEGVENNEMLYELITDAGWTNPGKTIDLDAWMAQYEQSRYGLQSSEMEAFHTVLRNTLYNNYKDHPRFAWQAANIGITGTAIGASVNNNFLTGVETLFSHADALKAANSTLLESELIEAAAMYVGTKIENLCQTIKAKKSDRAECVRLITALEDLMLDFDAALELHPIWNLKRWEDMARACGDKDAVRNAKNARRIVTVWFGDHIKDEPVQDYASRIWGGLMRDYYCPRLIKQLNADCGITGSFNRISFENQFVESAPYLSEPRPVEGNHIDFLVRLINKAKNFGEVEPQIVDNFIASTDAQSYWYVVRNTANDQVLTTAGDAKALTVADDSKESTQMWRIVATGADTYRLESRFGQNVAVVNGEARTYLPLVNCDVKIEKVNTTPGETTFAIKPVAGVPEFFDAEWTLEELTPSLVLEAASLDYTHYIRRLADFEQTELFGKTGEPFSEDALNEGIIALQHEANNIDHKTFGTFLSQWNTVLGNTVKMSEDTDVARLIELVMSAHQIIVLADADTDSKAADLLVAIQAAEKVAANGGDAVAAHAALTEAILAYYAAGGVVTDTEIADRTPHTWVFPIGFDENTAATHPNGRNLTYIALTPAGESEQKFEMSGDKVYVNATETVVFRCEPSATVTPVIGYNGGWMNGYFYIDLDNNGKLAYDINTQEQTECVSYTFWSGDLNFEDNGKNSLGQNVSGNARNSVSDNVITLPTFTAPAEVGVYNVRFKVDWNSVEPAGSTKQSILANGGYIIDAILCTGGATVGIEGVEAERSNAIYDLSGRRVQNAQKGVFIVNGRKVVR